MDMKIYSFGTNETLRCPFCGERPGGVWVTKITEGFYKGDLLHDCGKYSNIRIARFGNTVDEVVRGCQAAWNCRED